MQSFWANYQELLCPALFCVSTPWVSFSELRSWFEEKPSENHTRVHRHMEMSRCLSVSFPFPFQGSWQPPILRHATAKIHQRWNGYAEEKRHQDPATARAPWKGATGPPCGPQHPPNVSQGQRRTRSGDRNRSSLSGACFVVQGAITFGWFGSKPAVLGCKGPKPVGGSPKPVGCFERKLIALGFDGAPFCSMCGTRQVRRKAGCMLDLGVKRHTHMPLPPTNRTPCCFDYQFLNEKCMQLHTFQAQSSPPVEAAFEPGSLKNPTAMLASPCPDWPPRLSSRQRRGCDSCACWGVPKFRDFEHGWFL